MGLINTVPVENDIPKQYKQNSNQTHSQRNQYRNTYQNQQNQLYNSKVINSIEEIDDFNNVNNESQIPKYEHNPFEKQVNNADFRMKKFKDIMCPTCNLYNCKCFKLLNQHRDVHTQNIKTNGKCRVTDALNKQRTIDIIENEYQNGLKNDDRHLLQWEIDGNNAFDDNENYSIPLSNPALAISQTGNRRS